MLTFECHFLWPLFQIHFGGNLCYYLQLNWRNPSKYEYIKDGLNELVKAISAHKITSIAIPPLGCGNGGLKWEIVKGMIEEALKDVKADIYIYEPTTEIKSILQVDSTSKNAKLTPPRGLITYAMYYYDSLGKTVACL